MNFLASCLGWFILSAVAESIEPLPSYEIGTGDTIEIQVWAGQQKEESLCGEYFVFSSGVIEMPLLGSVVLDGESLENATQKIQSQLAATYIRNPHVTVKVQDYGSQIISVLGSVKRPGSFAMKRSTRLAEILAKAEGTDSAMKGAKQVKITRRNGETIMVDLDKMLRDGTGNIMLEGGDVIYVTEGQYVMVSGKVESPGQVPWREGFTVIEAVSAAGGPASSANLKDVYILRGELKIPINYKRMKQGGIPAYVLEQGDTLFVEESVW